MQLLKLPDGTVKVLVEGEKRIKINKFIEEDGNNFLTCEVEIIEDKIANQDMDMLAAGLVKKFERLQVLNKKDLGDSSTTSKI